MKMKMGSLNIEENGISSILDWTVKTYHPTKVHNYKSFLMVEPKDVVFAAWKIKREDLAYSKDKESLLGRGSYGKGLTVYYEANELVYAGIYSGDNVAVKVFFEENSFLLEVKNWE
jgi:hypothetical protein